MSETEDAIKQALVDHWRGTRPPEETAIVTRFLIVAEVVDNDGDMALRIDYDDNTPPWTVAGMLRGATLANDGDLTGAWEVDDE